jgi:hypothetical protein
MSKKEENIWDGFDFRDPEEAFEQAISEGRLSRDEKADNFAGNYMYMHTTNGEDCFKNIITRKYDV